MLQSVGYRAAERIADALRVVDVLTGKSGDEVADLFAYLRSKTQVPLPAR